MDPQPLAQASRYFETIWCFAADMGWCDAPYGAEYRRIFADWIREGMEHDVWTFIAERANAPPPRPC